MMHSCLYEGTIRHRRFRPVENAFRYRLFLVYLDLDELDQVFRLHPLWSAERFNLATFRRRDHAGDPQTPLDMAIRSLVWNRTGEMPNGPIRLLTHLRYFGIGFNPVSFYYCYDPSGTRVETIVAEISNTPWLETHCYVFPLSESEHPLPGWGRFRFSKGFHVSPFMDMNIRYDWRFRVPGERLGVHMINHENGKRLFDASLSLKRREITRPALGRALFSWPPMTAKVILMIYWQALRLWWKRAPFYPHPSKTIAKAET